MKLGLILLAAALLVVCAVGASAYPTIDGSTGVVNLPTAEIAPQGTIDLAVTYQQAPFDWNGVPVRVNAGVAKDWELYASYQPSRAASDGDNDDFITAGVKYSILNQAEDDVDLAIGGTLGKETWGWDDHETSNKAYLAVSKDFSIAPSIPLTARGTAGLLYNFFKGHGWNDSFTKPYVALELMNDSGVSLGMEYRWRDDDWDDDDALFSSVLRYQCPKVPLFLEVGTTNGEWLGNSWDNQRGFYGFGYTFDLK